MTSLLSVTLNIPQFYHASLILSHNCSFLSISISKATAIISIWTVKPTPLALTPTPASDLHFQQVLQHNHMADFQASPVPTSTLESPAEVTKTPIPGYTPDILMN